MPGLANPTPPVTEIDPDEDALDLLRQILAELKLGNKHLAIITKLEITADELEF